MTFPELDKKYDKVILGIAGNQNGVIMEQLAIEAFTLLRGRIQETGIDAHGQKYAPYSTKPMYIGCKSFKQEVCKALLNTKEKRSGYKWKTINGHHLAVLEGGYKKWRELQLGKGKGDLVNFSVTNSMWNNIMSEKPKASDLLSTKADHIRGIAIIGAKQDIEKKKLEGNTKRRGDILDLSKTEQDDLMRRYNLQVLQIFKENGL
jgi:hypothetical protein